VFDAVGGVERLGFCAVGGAEPGGIARFGVGVVSRLQAATEPMPITIIVTSRSFLITHLHVRFCGFVPFGTWSTVQDICQCERATPAGATGERARAQRRSQNPQPDIDEAAAPRRAARSIG